MLERLKFAESTSRNSILANQKNTLERVDPLVKTCLVASANPTKPTYFMNPAVRAIARA